MNKKQALLEDHKEMLDIRVRRIQNEWLKRNTYRYNRDLLRWTIEQAKFHKHMIAQLSMLPDWKNSWF